MSLINYNFDPLKFQELRKYYYTILNLNRNSFNLSNDELIPNINFCNTISNIPNELWRTDLNVLDQCCGNGNFSIPFHYKLNEVYSSKTIASLFVFCKVYIYYKRNSIN